MRPGQNKRMRGRNNNNNSGGNNRKGPNPLTRSYESNGPDVKIRGTAHHIGEKYLQLARDAQSSGDPVMAESYLQHAEHYFRLIASAQQAQQQAAYGYQRPAGEQAEPDDDGDDDDFGNLPDRFASPAERVVTPAPQPVAQAYPDRQPATDRQPSNGGDRQPYEQRQFDRQPQPNYERPPQGERQDRQQYDNRYPRDRNGYQDRNGQDRNGQDRNGQDRNGQDRQGNGQDRPQANRDTSSRDQTRDTYQDRNGADRAAQPDRQSQQDRQGQDRPQNQDRPARDYDNRNFRGNRGPRNFRENGEGRPAQEGRQPLAEETINGLPAFITAPTRPVTEPAAVEAPSLASNPVAGDQGEDGSFHLRPRRRRRSKAEMAGEGEAQHEAPASDPVGE